jgi:uncharacterized protein YndB with AHSA1/START domain
MLWLFNVLKAMIVLLGIFVGLAFLLPSHRHVERSLDISAPVQRVWGLIADPQQWTTWSPWSSKNPTLKVRFDAAESPKLLTYTLTWVDMGSQARGAFRLEPMPLGTRITWSLDAELGHNPMMRWFGLALDRWVGRDLESGLARLALISKA